MKVLVDFGCYSVLLFVVISGTLSPQSQVFVSAAPMPNAAPSTNNNQHVLPPLKHYDIWSAVNDDEKFKVDSVDDDDDFSKFTFNPEDLKIVSNNFSSLETWRQNIISNNIKRQSKVLHLFPVPVDGECLSDDGRRTGTCFNAYECRMKGGTAKGECAMGFGVCCIFIASCDQMVTNNITYLVSPNFPSFMPDNFTSCRLKVKLLNTDISQLRIDFFHFSLGQPNRRTGVCDGDVFNVTGGPGGTISLCGQNSGQHMYYDVDSRALARQQLYGSLKPLTYDQLYPATQNQSSNEMVKEIIEIIMNFTQRYLPSRLWEIRIVQIPFSQRAPAGCLQYYKGMEGVIQTFNYADNGRHLANQHYRICMRQETEMCSILYQPCDDQSFRIGPNEPFRTISGSDNTAESSPTTIAMETPSTSSPSTTTPVTKTTTTTTTSTTTTTTTTTTPAPETTIAADNSTEEDITTTVAPALSDDVEGSGDDFDLFTPSSLLVSRKPRPVSGGFDLLGFLRHALDLRRFARTLTQSAPNESQQQQKQRQKRQFIRKCTDRITLPCIIEDFIDAGFGPLPGCEPVHCGLQFCASGINPCCIESTVTPFYIGVNFGDGTGKGSAEDNIGACLRYTQVQCM